MITKCICGKMPSLMTNTVNTQINNSGITGYYYKCACGFRTRIFYASEDKDVALNQAQNAWNRREVHKDRQ